MKTVVLLARHEAVTNLAATSLTFNSQLLRRPSKLAAKALQPLHPPSKVPQDLTQLLDKAAKGYISQSGTGKGTDNAMAKNEMPHFPEKSITKEQPTYRVRLRTDRFTMRRMRSKFMLALFGTCMSKAAVSHLREEYYADSSDYVTCLVSCPKGGHWEELFGPDAQGIDVPV
ncbi:g6378 [Coccomyxa viridis]|uniref:G6378 protein n=1 Tax=Coccomyxa viridis TaxID=1274662 RepID=A0ABP1G095_9CHLO